MQRPADADVPPDRRVRAAPGGYQGGMTDPVELSELHAGGADPDDVTPEDPHADLDGTDENSPAEFGLPIDGTAPAEEDPAQS